MATSLFYYLPQRRKHDQVYPTNIPLTNATYEQDRETVVQGLLEG